MLCVGEWGRLTFGAFIGLCCLFDSEGINRPMANASSFNLAKLTAANAANGDGFGWAVDMSSDGKKVIVGANSANSLDGAAYIFEWSDINLAWEQVSKLEREASDDGEGINFGFAVAIDDDVALVGFPFWNSARGKVYVYRRDDSQTDPWPQNTTITIDGGSAYLFGWSLDISEDTAIIGASGESSSKGAAYIFNLSAGLVSQTTKLVAEDGNSLENFGEAVSISNNVAIIGTLGADAAYIFRETNGEWSQEEKLVASDGAIGDNFGNSVFIKGNLAIVGAPYHDSCGNVVSGAAYIFLNSINNDGCGIWNQVQKLTADDGAPKDYFGSSVGLFGNNIIVGAYGNDDSDRSYTGAAYVFYEEYSVCGCREWFQSEKLSPTNLEPDDNFGFSIATSDDTFVVGAYSGTGSAYVGQVEASTMPSIFPSLSLAPSNEPSFAPSFLPSSQPSSSSRPSTEPSIVPSSRQLTLISEIQGKNGNDGNGGDISPLAGDRVMVEAIVVGIFLGSDKLGGFFMQEEDEDTDNDPRTSEGIFVHYPSPVGGLGIDMLKEGDKVSLIGRVSEVNTETQITSVDMISIITSGNPLPTPATIGLNAENRGVLVTSVGYIADLERFEGMLVQFKDSTKPIVSDISNFERYGEIVLTGGDLPIHFSQVDFPSSSDYDWHLRRISSLQVALDDGSITEYPNLADYPAFSGTFNTNTAVRIGDRPSTDLVGCLGYSFGRFRIHPTRSFKFERKAEMRKVGGKAGKGKKEFQIAVADVSKYFATLDINRNQVGPNGDQDPRGANSSEEFDRQTEKLLTALMSLDSDVFGLVQVENDFGESSSGNAVKILVEELNAISDDTFDWVRPQQDGTPKAYVDESDAVSNAFIYKPSYFSVAGVNVLSDSNLPVSFAPPIFNGVNSNRGTLAVTFQVVDDHRRRLRENGGRSLEERELNLFDGNDECITMVLCHFSSRDSVATGLGNQDKGDGAGGNNALRLKASQAIVEWLKGNPTGVACPNVMIMGNLNAYLKEDPIQYFLNNGFKSLMEEDVVTFTSDGYWGSLDYQLYNNELFEKVKDFESINLNSYISHVLDYHLYPTREPTWFDGSVPYRYSDHDPLATEVKF